MKNERRQELQELHERMIFFVQRARINSYLPLFFLISALLYAGFLYLCEVVFPPITQPGLPGRVYYIDRHHRHLLTGLDSRSSLKRNIPSWADPARSAHEYVRLDTEAPPNLKPLPAWASPAPFAYSMLQPAPLPPVQADDGTSPAPAASAASAQLEGIPAAWGPMKRPPIDNLAADPGWIGRKVSFLVVLDEEGAPEQANLMSSSGSPDADRAAAAFLRTARWPVSRTPRSALIRVTWKEVIP